jgi:hypothetical protein
MFRFKRAFEIVSDLTMVYSMYDTYHRIPSWDEAQVWWHFLPVSCYGPKPLCFSPVYSRLPRPHFMRTLEWNIILRRKGIEKEIGLKFVCVLLKGDVELHSAISFIGAVHNRNTEASDTHNSWVLFTVWVHPRGGRGSDVGTSSWRKGDWCGNFPHVKQQTHVRCYPHNCIRVKYQDSHIKSCNCYYYYYYYYYYWGTR